jgi:hypothetical protein
MSMATDCDPSPFSSACRRARPVAAFQGGFPCNRQNPFPFANPRDRASLPRIGSVLNSLNIVITSAEAPSRTQRLKLQHPSRPWEAEVHQGGHAALSCRLCLIACNSRHGDEVGLRHD